MSKNRSTALADSPTNPEKKSLQTILAQFREAARNNRDLGDRFERLIHRYFELDPLYADRFERVWMWNDWPKKGKVGDVGIDLVAQLRATGEYCGIQCKFYLPENTIAKEHIDSFFTALGNPLLTSGIIVSTTDKWGKNADQAIATQTKPVQRISVHDLEQSPIDWSHFSLKTPEKLSLLPKKQTRPHQTAAIDDVISRFTKADRGKLIMACGTGKTFTALRIAERLAPGGHVLFLVPSLSLMSQSLREWTAEAETPIHPMAVCSDPNIGKSRKKGEDDAAEITLYDLAFPATTSAKALVTQYAAIQRRAKLDKSDDHMTVVFSTYQSIDAVSQAQKAGLPDFDLIICDEAHRTTGVTLTGEDESHFVKVHDANFLKAAKRLYMTATPRIYGDQAKTKAKEAEAELCSMDDPQHFGEEFHRLGFGEAVGKSLLSDYKVLVLAVDEKYISKTFQRQIADANNELNLDDAVKITGCWNGLAKRFESAVQATADLQGDTGPMRRAVAFSRSIKDSKAFVQKFAQIIAAYTETHPDDTDILQVQADHVDGTYDALRRGALLDWLKADSPDNTCRILSNARCLSEGVDVPALDSVIFLNPRNSVIDVVQSVGRVMRRAEGKHYGYIILPIGIPADVKPEEALKDNEKYKVVWQVLQALRAHDDRFNATINQIELNKSRPDNIQVIGVGDGDSVEDAASDGDSKPTVREVQGALAFPQLDEWKDAIYGKIVLKCGDRRYWETWAKDVARIAERHVTRIKALLESDDKPQAEAFETFLTGLRNNLNPAVTKDDAIEMLSQHLITRPVFDALFEGYAFTQHNPVSLAMQKMLDTLKDEALEKETAALEKFYASVRERAKGIDNAEGRQRVVVELYDKFFRTAFPRMAERLGIVYTPIEVVDFIIRSVEDILHGEFQSGLGHEDVHIIDPFTGTGTFIVRLLQSGLIPAADLERKYKTELHANEIVLLAYYIAAINIEETFHSLRVLKEPSPSGRGQGEGDPSDYLPFDGIVLTDTFQLDEPRGEIIEKAFPENNQRVQRQKAAPIRVVIANPPYSSKQEDANDANQNLAYPALDGRIRRTYAQSSTSLNVRSLYDSHIRAIRWASDRIKGRGVVGFVTNGSFIDASNMDGLRASLADEFTSLYVFNLRGNARTQGEVRRTEAGNVFGGGTRTPVAITLLVKNPARSAEHRLFYHDIGDYLSQAEKLAIVKRFGSITSIAAENNWTILKPNPENDWINQRDPAFEKFIVIGDKSDSKHIAIFGTYSQGVLTARDAWTFNFSAKAVDSNVRRMIASFEEQRRAFENRNDPDAKVEEFLDLDSKKVSWSRSLKADLSKNKKLSFEPTKIVTSLYRPFTKQELYFDRRLNEYVSLMPKLFPAAKTNNLGIITTGIAGNKEFSSLICNVPCEFATLANGQCFPLYHYEAESADVPTLLDTSGDIIDGYRRRDAIRDAILKKFREAYGKDVGKEDIFYYIYGILHSPEYRTRFAADLKKMLPRIPLTRKTADFHAFTQAGRDLAHWHLNYETIDPYPLVEHSDQLAFDPETHFTVQKMTYGRPTPEQKAQGQKCNKTTIIYNSHVTLTGIPPEALDYVVNGKPAIEWIMERYEVTVDKDSGIRNDPNDWSREHNQPRYIIDLVKRIVRVSVETMKIVNSLPALNERIETEQKGRGA